MFIHKALLEAVENGNTAITAPNENMAETINQLASTDPETGKTGFQIQFEVLLTLNVIMVLSFFLFQMLHKGNQGGNFTDRISLT